jgi:phospholipid/cholesterol/gamma-HCH transport system substrate-binding protein
MTALNLTDTRTRWLRIALAVLLVVVLVVGVYLVWPARAKQKVVGYFTSAVGIYPGDDVSIIGVPVGKIDSIEPRAADVKITMSIDDGVKLPKDAKALIIAPNLVSSRFIQFTPAYTEGDVLANGAELGLERTGVPVAYATSCLARLRAIDTSSLAIRRLNSFISSNLRPSGSSPAESTGSP